MRQVVYLPELLLCRVAVQVWWIWYTVSCRQPAYVVKLTTFPPNVTTEWLAFLSCIEQVLGPNIFLGGRLVWRACLGALANQLRKVATDFVILIIKANEMRKFSNLFDKVLYIFRTAPLSIIRSISCRVLYQINLRNSASRWLFVIRIYDDSRSSECQISFGIFFGVSVRPSAWNNVTPIGRIFVKFHILNFYKNFSMNSDFG